MSVSPSASSGAQTAATAASAGVGARRAIVVLGSKVFPSGDLTSALQRRADRAAEAFHAGVAPVVVVSGGRRWGAQVEALCLREALARAGVPRASVLPELFSFTTYENAIFTAVLLRERGIEEAAIVTCSWHMPRAMENFESTGLRALALPSRDVPAATFTRLRRACGEAMSRWFDARARLRASVLAENAAAYRARESR